jgi:glycosylphosphatidylinositol transamidase (GPIT) subunit GPI8
MQSNTHALFVGRDYWGTVLGVQTALKFKNFLVSKNVVKEENVTVLLGNDVNVSSVTTHFSNICAKLNEPNTTVIIYMVGHGNQVCDVSGDEPDSRDEVYQLPDGNILDDTLTQIVDSQNIPLSSKLLLVTDFCSSGTMLDERLSGPLCNWINISSSMDYEDSYASDEGNVMTACLISVLEKIDDIKSITAQEIRMLLVSEIKESFIGELQHPWVCVSHPAMWDRKIFFNLS